MAIELNRQTGEPVTPGGFRGVVPPGEQSTPVTLDNHVTLDYDHADEVIPHHYAFAVSGAEFEAAFGRIRDAASPTTPTRPAGRPGRSTPARAGTAAPTSATLTGT